MTEREPSFFAHLGICATFYSCALFFLLKNGRPADAGALNEAQKAEAATRATALREKSMFVVS